MKFDKIEEMLIDIGADIKLIKNNLAEDYKHLHGNGKPGLIEQQHILEMRIAKVEDSVNELKEAKKNRAALISSIIANAIALAAVIVSIFC